MPLINPKEVKIIRFDKTMLKKGQLLYDHLENLEKGFAEKVAAELGEDWFEIRTRLSFFEREQVKTYTSFQLAGLQIDEKSQSVDADKLEMAENRAKAKLNMLKAYLVNWSFSEPISETALWEGLTEYVGFALLEIVASIHKKQWGPTEDSTLGKL